MKRIAIAAAFVLLLGNFAQAALLITPDSGILNFSRWEVDDNANLTIAQIAAIVSPVNALTLQYTAAPNGADGGPLAASYVTTFSNTATDPANALIDYIGGEFVDGSQIFLLVKDGNQDPAQYIFRISSFTIAGGPWDGTEDINLVGFWPDQGAISHLSILDGGPPGVPDQQDIDPPAVPEPGTLAIWGLLSFAGLVTSRRRKV